MKSAKLSLMLIGMASLLPAVSTAQIFNPDNDSASFFASRPAVRADFQPSRLPAVGELSADHRYVWKNPEQGWANVGHTYVIADGRIEHAPGCLAYNSPKPASGYSPEPGPGA